MTAARIASIQTSRERGGAEFANVDLLAGLVRRGHDVVLLTNLPDLGTPEVRVHPIHLGPKLSRRTVLRTAAAIPLILVRLSLALRSERPVAATLLHFKKEQLLSALVPRRLTGRVVWAEWGPLPEPLRRGMPRRLYALAARRAAAIMAVSEGTRDSLVAAGVPAAKVAVVPNLMDVDALRFDPEARTRLRAAWGAGEDTFVIGCISRYQRRKRVDVAIDAMAHLRGEGLLVLAGEGENEAALRARAVPYGDRVRFVPSPRGHVQEYLSACDVLLFAPSPTEGAPRVITEGQLVGVPVIATDTPGTAGLIHPGEGAVVSPPHDPRAVAEVLTAYRDDPERRRREAAAARRRAAEAHAPAIVLARVESLLRG